MTERERFENWAKNETRLPSHAYWAAWLGWQARAQAKLEAQSVSGQARVCSHRNKIGNEAGATCQDCGEHWIAPVQPYTLLIQSKKEAGE
jgi:hypothetical protein